LTRLFAIAVSMLIFRCTSRLALAAESPVAPGVKLEKLADGFGFTEGPSVDLDGNVYITARAVTVFDKTGAQIEKTRCPSIGRRTSALKQGRTTAVHHGQQCHYGLRMRVKSVSMELLAWDLKSSPIIGLFFGADSGMSPFPRG